MLLLPHLRLTNSSFCFPLYCFSSSSFVILLLSLTVGLVLSVPAVGGRYTPATGCAVQGETHTTWHVLPATHARGSCPQERSLAWWRRRSCAGSTTTPWWRISNEQLRVVSGGSALNALEWFPVAIQMFAQESSWNRVNVCIIYILHTAPS